MSKPSVTRQIEALIEQFGTKFMSPQIRTRLTVSQIENAHGETRFAARGEECLSADETITETYTNVSLCRLSAPGYLDCTEWTLCHDKNDILEWLSDEADYLDELGGSDE